MAQICAINIGTQKYDIYASSAISAEILTNTDILVASATSASVADKLKTARDIAATGDVTWSVSFDGTSNQSGNATINNVASAISWSGVSAAVESAIGEKFAGVYTVRGTKTVAQINALTDMKVGDVYNVSDSGTIAGQTILAGDNVVCTATTGTNKWDKLAATLDTSNFVKKDDATYTATTARAKSWADTSANLISSAKSGFSALSSISANSASWTANDNTKYSLSGWNGVTASYTSDGSTTALKVSGVPATSAAVGVTKASYVSENVAYIF